jgi:hypothetical protein
MPVPRIPKTYVRPDNTAVLTCPHCGRQKVILSQSFKGYKHKLRIKCACQDVFTVILEFRNRGRRKTHLRGTYINHSREGNKGQLIIEDISVTGLAFSSLNLDNFQVGDALSIEFALDDEHQTPIRKDVIVRDVRQRSVGCEYEKSEDTFGSPLGYYIMSNL